MIEDGYMLDETVVIGYGTQTKRTITSAMTSIKSEELSGYVGSSIEQTISGLVPEFVYRLPMQLPVVILM